MGKIAGIVQLAVSGVVLFLVVKRQTSTVVYTPQVALNWVWSHRIVENMSNELNFLARHPPKCRRDMFDKNLYRSCFLLL